MSETQRIKDKKKTITTIRNPSIPSHSKSSQTPKAYTSLSQILPINDVSPSLFPSRIFFPLCYSSFCGWLVIQNSLVSSNYCPNSLSHVLGVIYLNISDLIPSMLICNQRHLCLSLSLVHYITNSHLLICDYEFQSSKGLRSKVQMVTKDIVKSEV